MSGERRSEIYVTRKLAKRLRSALRIYPFTIKQGIEDQFGYRTTMDRVATVEDLVEQILNEHIEKHYPAVIELETGVAHLEKQVIAKVKECTKTNPSGMKQTPTSEDNSTSSEPSLALEV